MGVAMFARFGCAVMLLAVGVVGSGCQLGPTVTGAQLLRNRGQINTTGLKDVETYKLVKAQAAVPARWEQLNIKQTALFTDMQWRSPTKLTGVGVAYVRMPLPLPAAALIWFAKNEYCKKSNDGKLLAEWTDSIGRPWFEAENNKYHVRGYVVTKGFEAWIVYTGYRTASPPSEQELMVAHRAQETIIPTPLAPNRARMPTANVD